MLREWEKEDIQIFVCNFFTLNSSFQSFSVILSDTNLKHKEKRVWKKNFLKKSAVGSEEGGGKGKVCFLKPSPYIRLKDWLFSHFNQPWSKQTFFVWASPSKLQSNITTNNEVALSRN